MKSVNLDCIICHREWVVKEQEQDNAPYPRVNHGFNALLRYIERKKECYKCGKSGEFDE